MMVKPDEGPVRRGEVLQSCICSATHVANISVTPFNYHCSAVSFAPDGTHRVDGGLKVWGLRGGLREHHCTCCSYSKTTTCTFLPCTMAEHQRGAAYSFRSRAVLLRSQLATSPLILASVLRCALRFPPRRGNWVQERFPVADPVSRREPRDLLSLA